MENVFNTHASTTYRIGYPLGNAVPPPIKYHQQPAIQLRKEPKLQPRAFPISPAGPTRGWEKGTGQVLQPDIRHFTDKPIVRAPRPQDIIIPPPPRKSKPGRRPRTSASHKLPSDPLLGLNEPLAPVVPSCADGYPVEVGKGWVEELCRAYHWKTTSKEAAKEGCLQVPELTLPTTTMEPKSDLLVYRPMRYDGHQLSWQRVAPVWDRLQERPHCGDNVISSRQIGGGTEAIGSGKRLPSPKKAPPKKRKDISVDDKILQLVKEDKMSSMFVRSCPGYAGYVPRSLPKNVAIETSLVPDLRTTTTMKGSFRPFASKEYTVKAFAHKGPLSRTVTLTYPYNPYNKVYSRAEEIERKW